VSISRQQINLFKLYALFFFSLLFRQCVYRKAPKQLHVLSGNLALFISRIKILTLFLVSHVQLVQLVSNAACVSYFTINIWFTKRNWCRRIGNWRTNVCFNVILCLAKRITLYL